MSVLAAGDEKLAVLAELDRRDAVLMPFQGVDVATFKQVKDLREAVISSRDHVVAGRMEVQTGNASIEDSVILNQLAHLEIEDLDARVFLCDGNEIAVSVPAQLVAVAPLVLECVDEIAGFDVENSQRLVLGARCDHSIVGRETSAADPVGVTCEGADEVAMRQAPHLDRLIVARRDQPISGAGEVNRADL